MPSLHLSLLFSSCVSYTGVVVYKNSYCIPQIPHSQQAIAGSGYISAQWSISATCTKVDKTGLP